MCHQGVADRLTRPQLKDVNKLACQKFAQEEDQTGKKSNEEEEMSGAYPHKMGQEEMERARQVRSKSARRLKKGGG